MRRAKFAVLMLAIWIAIGAGTYVVLSLSRSSVFGSGTAGPPDSTTALVNLVGSMYLEQNGDVYLLKGGHFSKFSMGNHLMQVSGTSTTGNFVGVQLHENYSDLVQLNTSGAISKKLTSNQTPYLDTNNWAYWPQVTQDGSQIFFSTDRPKYGYQVDFSIWAMNVDGSKAHQWTQPNAYTGGDTAPIPLKNGSLLYAGYGIGGSSNTAYSQVLLQKRAFAIPVELTTAEDNCSQPEISSDQTLIAMVCSTANSTKIEEASFDGSTIGPLKVLVENCQCAWPTFAPDGSGIVYLAPAASDGPFQLWWLPNKTLKPLAVTTSLAFDGSSAPLWLN